MAFSTGRWQYSDHCRADRLAVRSKVNAASHNPRGIKPEGSLKSVVARPNQVDEEKLHRYIRKTAAGLAAFHRSRASYGEHVDLRKLIHRLTVLLPEFEGAVHPLLERLENLAALYPKETAVPTEPLTPNRY